MRGVMGKDGGQRIAKCYYLQRDGKRGNFQYRIRGRREKGEISRQNGKKWLKNGIFRLKKVINLKNFSTQNGTLDQ